MNKHMRFDNAFLTKAGKLGMQFSLGYNQMITVYEGNKNGQLEVTEEASTEDKIRAIQKYQLLRPRYMPAKAS